MEQEDNISIRPLSAALRKKAEEELNETPEKIVKHLKIIRDWIKTQPDLQTMKTTNQWLIAFLRGCKHDLEKTKGKLKMYAAYKTTLPEYYGNRDPFDPDIQEILKMGIAIPLQNTMTEDDAPVVCLYRPGYFSLSKRPLVDLLKVTLMVLEILMLEDDNFVVAGKGTINDLLGMELRFILQVTPSLARKTLTCIEKTLSIRIKNLQVLNPPYGLSILLAVIKMFMKTKAINRIIIHKKDSLYDHVDKSLLPEEYGGTNGTLQEHIVPIVKLFCQLKTLTKILQEAAKRGVPDIVENTFLQVLPASYISFNRFEPIVLTNRAFGVLDYWKAKVESYRDWFVDENTSDTKH